MTRAVVNMSDKFEDEETLRLPLMPHPRGPADESPTVALLDRWRNRKRPAVAPRQHPRGDDGGFAERFLRDRRRS